MNVSTKTFSSHLKWQLAPTHRAGKQHLSAYQTRDTSYGSVQCGKALGAQGSVGMVGLLRDCDLLCKCDSCKAPGMSDRYIK